jgi:hypothetical protein
MGVPVTPLPSVERLRAVLRYDAETGRLFWLPRPGKLKWTVQNAGKEAFTANTLGYRCGTIDGVRFQAHRVIWKIVHGREPKGQIDHIDGNRSNNRVENLRDVSNAENARNRRPYCRTTSGTLGVSWTTHHRRWRAYITVEGKQIALGTFREKSDAIAARRAAEAKYGFGA